MWVKIKQVKVFPRGRFYTFDKLEDAVNDFLIKISEFDSTPIVQSNENYIIVTYYRHINKEEKDKIVL